MKVEMQKAGKAASRILAELRKIIKEGVTGININAFAERFIDKRYPGFNLASRGYKGFPASLCVSINEEIIHGIPSQRIIRNGDLVKADVVVGHRGWFADTAMTYTVGKVSPGSKKAGKDNQGRFV